MTLQNSFRPFIYGRFLEELMEQWKTIHDFPMYSVSTSGRVRNDETGRLMALTLNKEGIRMVGMQQDREHHKRSVTLLVAKAFIPRPYGPFDTPINLDGDRSNNNVQNLMWRPRWFAYKYHQQFKRYTINRIRVPIIEVKTGEVSEDSRACAMQYGLLEKDLILSVVNRTYVWPTYQIFQIAPE